MRILILGGTAVPPETFDPDQFDYAAEDAALSALERRAP